MLDDQTLLDSMRKNCHNECASRYESCITTTSATAGATAVLQFNGDDHRKCDNRKGDGNGDSIGKGTSTSTDPPTQPHTSPVPTPTPPPLEQQPQHHPSSVKD
jgi:hypothetical protein